MWQLINRWNDSLQTRFWFLLQKKNKIKIVRSRYDKWMDIDINLQWPNSIKFHLCPALRLLLCKSNWVHLEFKAYFTTSYENDSKMSVFRRPIVIVNALEMTSTIQNIPTGAHVLLIFTITTKIHRRSNCVPQKSSKLAIRMSQL